MWITAREEAAHALAAVVSPHTFFDSVTIVREGTALGRIRRVGGPIGHVGFVMMCGALATDTNALKQGRMPKMDEDDVRGVSRLTAQVKQEALLCSLDWMRRPKTAAIIDVLAKELLRRQSLTCQEVREFVSPLLGEV